MRETITTYLIAHPLAEFALIMGVILAVGYVMQLLRQPSIVGYIVAGIVLSPQLHGIIQGHQSVDLFAHIGIALLLFLVGLGLSARIIREVGKIAVITGVGQVLFTTIVGMALAMLLGNSRLTALLLGVGLAFSSTIVIVKLISDRKDTHKLYGKISVGFLIIQDIIAMLILIAFALIGAIQSSGGDMSIIVQRLGSIILAIVLTRLITRYLLNKMVHIFSHSEEYLLLFSVGWALIVAAGFELAGLSMEAGALIAGMTLAESSEKFLIASKIKTLRDFFIALFFIYMGSNLVFDGMAGIWGQVIVLSLFVLIGNPLIVFVMMKKLHYDWRTSFMTGLTVAQISEFSFIVMTMGLSMGIITDQSILTITTFVALITMAGSSYLFYYADPIMDRIERHVPRVTRTDVIQRSVDRADEAYDVIVVGYGTHGQRLCRALPDDVRILVLEYDPYVAHHATVPSNVTILHADVTENEIWREVEQHQVRFVVVTSSELDVIIATHHYNEHLDRHIIAHVEDEEDALMLYDKGVDIVHVVHEAAVDHTIQLMQQSDDIHHVLGKHKTDHLHHLTDYIQDAIGSVITS